MMHYFRKIKYAAKAALLCISLFISLFFTVMSAQLQNEKQTFDMKSSILISLGFGTAICLFINNRKKV